MRSLAAGCFCGFLVSVPVGPVNLTVINQALRNGFWVAFLSGLGAIFAESIYASLMLAGHSSILDKPSVVLVLRIAAVVIIALLGIRYLLANTEKLELSSAVAERVDQRWHHPRSFLLGFILTISNLMLVLMWATLAAVLFARDWVQPELASRSVCIAGVFAGGALWFFLLAFFVSRAHRRVKPKTLTALVRASGIVFLLFAVLLAYKLFYPTPAGHSIELIHHTP
jgi:threonine/homoserine/homoserine lactone efflux protein